MPTAGMCPAGTVLSPVTGTAGCCFPPDHPTCVVPDLSCGAGVTCACFSSNPCAPQACVNTFSGGHLVCMAP
jgi:hypothetical protein